MTSDKGKIVLNNPLGVVLQFVTNLRRIMDESCTEDDREQILRLVDDVQTIVGFVADNIKAAEETQYRAIIPFIKNKTTS